MERFLGLDVGEKTIGLAVSDPLGITAQAVTTIKRTSNKEDYERVKEYIDYYKIESLVVGLPYNMNGSLGPSADRAKKFAEKLRNKYQVQIIYQDERMTTMSAERVLIEAGVRRENRKTHIDKIAAVFILQAFLDSRF
ncbi:MAG: Holliday junction resolvase RuvX [Bacillota bacterium]|nr:Holliday junction resolvase RuvX [Bacillota bacterium]